MTGTEPAAPAAQPARDDLTARVFRALYQHLDLHLIGGAYLVVPKGAPCFVGPSLGEIARQISEHEHAGVPSPSPPGTPAGPAGSGPAS